MDFDMRRESSPEPSPGGMLDEPIFAAFGNDASAVSPEAPTELQKNDPLGTQIWKLYSRAKTQLPNAERMSNLTWRMMALNMRRAEEQRNRGYERRHPLNRFQHCTALPCHCTRLPQSWLTLTLACTGRVPCPRAMCSLPRRPPVPVPVQVQVGAQGRRCALLPAESPSNCAPPQTSRCRRRCTPSSHRSSNRPRRCTTP